MEYELSLSVNLNVPAAFFNLGAPLLVSAAVSSLEYSLTVALEVRNFHQVSFLFHLIYTSFVYLEISLFSVIIADPLID